GHRAKVLPSCLNLYPALVARPVGRAVIAANPAASKAMECEWNRFRSKTVWDEDHPSDWSEVRYAAKKQCYDVHSGHLGSVCVEKNVEMDAQYRKYKSRVVFLGNAVVD
ncbi:MAG: hypothetical protein ACKPKO_25475, partial [Candidatus Fonsibacter sp.]